MWFIYTMDSHSAMEKATEIMPLKVTRMELGEVSQAEKENST